MDSGGLYWIGYTIRRVIKQKRYKRQYNSPIQQISTVINDEVNERLFYKSSSNQTKGVEQYYDGRFFFFFLFIEIHNLSNLDIWWNFLTVKLACWWLSPAGYHPRVCSVMSFIRSAGCFLFSLLSMFMVLYVSAASRFECVAILDLYFSEYLLISSLTVGIPRSLRMSSFLTYQGLFTIVLRILAYITSILFIWLIAAVPHNGIPYVQIGFMIVLYIFNLFSMLNLDFRLVSQRADCSNELAVAVNIICQVM